MRLYWSVLRRNPQYAKLWLAQVVSLTGDWFGTVVLSTLVAALSGGSGLALSLFFLTRVVPPLVLSAQVGEITDRYNRRHVLIVSNLSRGLIVPMYLLATTPDLLWLVYVVSVAQAVMSALYEPAQSAIMPSLLREEDLIAGNTLLNVTWSAVLALGAAAGGLFAVTFGTTAELLFDALTFVFAGLMTWWIAYDPMRRQRSAKPSGDTSFLEGLRYLRQHPSLAWSLMVKGATSLGNVDTLLAVMATQVFVLGSQGELSLSILYATFGVGAFFGPIMLNRWNNGSLARMRLFILIGFALAFVAWGMMAAAGSLVLLALAVLVRGVGGSINWTFSSIMVQRQSTDGYLGRMFSIDYALFYFTTILSTLAHGALVDLLGVEGLPTILLLTAGAAAVPLLIGLVQVPRLNRLKLSAAGD